MPRLRRVDCSEPGIRRVRRGRSFSYETEDGKTVRDEETLERIRGLAIPPAWKDVWICLHPRGHIQATGYDMAGRKQYLYHDLWRAHRDREKFERMVGFGEVLPELRRRVEGDLAGRGLVRERVLACAVRLLDLGMFRVGGEQYAEENDTYGLATLKKTHVRFERGAAVFEYRAKNSQRHVRVITDELVLPTVRSLSRRRGGGSDLLAYRNGGRTWTDVRSEHINDYVKEVAGDEFSAKDFRTWNATVLAAVALAAHDGLPASKAARKRAAKAAVEQVARYLSNTPAVCRNSYIDPRVLDRFDTGETIKEAVSKIAEEPDPCALPNRDRVERAVLELIR